jgi:hypothetical protein
MHMDAHVHVTLLIVASVFLIAFTALSAVDGIYLHLIRYRLHASAASYREHLYHTVRAILFAPILLSLFTSVTGGALLWLATGLVAVDQAAELLDMWSEKDSRAPVGGLSSAEYTLHVALTTLRSVAIALAFASRPAAAWSLDAPAVLGPLPGRLAFLVGQLVPGAVVVAVAHIWLAIRHRPTGAPVAA